MSLITSRKLTWIICIVGILLAVISIFFLPDMIPMHFSNGVADGFGSKIEIFLFPVLLLVITVLSGREKVRYCLMHSKRVLTDVEYNWMIDGVLGIIIVAEMYVVYASFC